MKRKKILGVQREFFSNKQVRKLQHLSDTWGWCRTTSYENAALLRLEAIIRLLEEISTNETGARAISARGLLLHMDAELVHLLRFFIFCLFFGFFVFWWGGSDILGKVNKYHCSYKDKQTDLGKAAQLISSPRKNIVNIQNLNLTRHYSDSIIELSKNLSVKGQHLHQVIFILIFLPNFWLWLINWTTVSLLSPRSFFLAFQLFVPEDTHFYLQKIWKIMRQLTQCRWFTTWNSSCKEVTVETTWPTKIYCKIPFFFVQL